MLLLCILFSWTKTHWGIILHGHKGSIALDCSSETISHQELWSFRPKSVSSQIVNCTRILTKLKLCNFNMAVLEYNEYLYLNQQYKKGSLYCPEAKLVECEDSL